MMLMLQGLRGGAAVAADTTAPTLSSATINAAGTSLTLAFSESVSVGAGGNGGWTVSLSGGAATVSYASGSGSSSLVYTLSRTVDAGETGTTSYTQPGNGIEDAAGNDLANVSSASITNNSTAGGEFVVLENFNSYTPGIAEKVTGEIVTGTAIDLEWTDEAYTNVDDSTITGMTGNSLAFNFLAESETPPARHSEQRYVIDPGKSELWIDYDLHWPANFYMYDHTPTGGGYYGGAMKFFVAYSVDYSVLHPTLIVGLNYRRRNDAGVITDYDGDGWASTNFSYAGPNHVAGRPWVADDYCVNPATGFAYRCTTGGLGGSSAPTGTGTGIVDGDARWSYYNDTPRIYQAIPHTSGNRSELADPYTMPRVYDRSFDNNTTVGIVWHIKMATGPFTRDGICEGWVIDSVGTKRKFMDVTDGGWYGDNETSTGTQLITGGYFLGTNGQAQADDVKINIDNVRFSDTDYRGAS